MPSSRHRVTLGLDVLDDRSAPSSTFNPFFDNFDPPTPSADSMPGTVAAVAPDAASADNPPATPTSPPAPATPPVTTPPPATPPAAETPTPKPLDKAADPTSRKEVDGWVKDGLFPKLGGEYEVQKPCNEDYNCIGYTLGKGPSAKDGWVNPKADRGTTNGERLGTMDSIYTKAGYKRVDGLDYKVEAGKTKVIIYAIVADDGKILDVTHGAIQNPDGTWSSKMGNGPVIRHGTPDALTGDSYGKPIGVYVK